MAASRWGRWHVSEGCRPHVSHVPWHLQEVQRAEVGAQAAAALSDYQAATDADEVDLQLIAALLGRLCSDPGFSLAAVGPASAALGALLVFLPGQHHPHGLPSSFMALAG